MILLEILNYFGINFNLETIPDVVAVNLSFFILSIFSLIAILNILLYITVLLNKDNKYILNIVEKHWILKKMFNMYILTSKIFIVIEIIILVFSLCSICFISFIIINAYFKIF